MEDENIHRHMTANDPQDGARAGSRIPRRMVLQSIGIGGATLAGPGGVAGVTAASCPETDGEAKGPPPGPELLYSPQPVGPAHAPAPKEGWRADPLLVSGAEAYDEGEYLYQDYVYDDNGANTTDTIAAPNPEPNNDTFSPPTGDVVYPTDASTYGYNAADLLEFRARLTDDGVAYRVAFQTMKDPTAAAVAIGIDTGSDGGFDDWGHGIGSLGSLGLDHVIVASPSDTGWGATVKSDGDVDLTASATVDPSLNQVELTLESAPDGASWRHYVVTGLWDDSNQEFKQIQDEPSEDQPGGAHGRDPPPVFNVGFRFEEPAAGVNIDRGEYETELQEARQTPGTRGSGYGHWREHRQAKALAERDIADLHADINFGFLEDGVVAREVPETGLFYRLYGSQFDLGEGVGNGVSADGSGADVLLNRIQPYTIYVPEGYDPSQEHPLHINLHGFTSSHSEVAAFYPDFLRQLGEARDAIVLSPEARGPGLGYENAGELDVLESMADVVNRYNVDFERITLSGYSMGGSGTFRLVALYPDLFAKGFPIVGSGTDEREAGLLPNLRNVPILMWNGSNDELVPATAYLPTEQELKDLGYQHELDVFLGFDHFMFGFEDDWGPARDFLDGAFLGDATVEDTPTHITYRRVLDQEPSLPNDAGWELSHDKAYWVSDIELAGDAASGLVDVRSEAFGDAPPVLVNIRGAGTDPHQHLKRGTRWDESVEAAPVRNKLDVTLDAVSAVTFWVDEANVDPAKPLVLAVDSSRVATITVKSAVGQETVQVDAGSRNYTVHLCPPGP